MTTTTTAAGTSVSPSVSTVGIIGAGHIGSAVAEVAIDAGFDVVIANSRGPETLADVIAELGPKARAATAAEAAAAGDIAVVTVPLKSYRAVPAEPLAGKVVLDTNNYYPQRDGQIASLDEGTATSSGLLQEHLAGAHVVKVFNNIYSGAIRELPRRVGDLGRTALPIFGDDAAAKATAEAFLDAIGFDAVDGGPLAESWRSEPDRPVYGAPYAGDGDMTKPTPGSATTVRELLESATR